MSFNKIEPFGGSLIEKSKSTTKPIIKKDIEDFIRNNSKVVLKDSILNKPRRFKSQYGLIAIRDGFYQYMLPPKKVRAFVYTDDSMRHHESVEHITPPILLSVPISSRAAETGDWRNASIAKFDEVSYCHGSLQALPYTNLFGQVSQSRYNFLVDEDKKSDIISTFRGTMLSHDYEKIGNNNQRIGQTICWGDLTIPREQTVINKTDLFTNAFFNGYPNRDLDIVGYKNLLVNVPSTHPDNSSEFIIDSSDYSSGLSASQNYIRAEVTYRKAQLNYLLSADEHHMKLSDFIKYLSTYPSQSMLAMFQRAIRYRVLMSDDHEKLKKDFYKAVLYPGDTSTREDKNLKEILMKDDKYKEYIEQDSIIPKEIIYNESNSAYAQAGVMYNCRTTIKDYMKNNIAPFDIVGTMYYDFWSFIYQNDTKEFIKDSEDFEKDLIEYIRDYINVELDLGRYFNYRGMPIAFFYLQSFVLKGKELDEQMKLAATFWDKMNYFNTEFTVESALSYSTFDYK